ncbi:hypothetical protein PFICI_11595 [Pestalotiopsis fici W106-1]|uniref:CN hydrolase domain-containing protein n=1 Tax=Pestalotiopsis fici (strain W106-1 / CGMCC3.15140) TaxID=1229662 RepID=W3WQT8_PESFW|nr:uncharacterized protein PFICI_11595 [Pestalotiopsis fici W106-1]ETS76208.1 hypothetical protein PFICI_11595 [Pestalotiopsis fici W106-1]
MRKSALLGPLLAGVLPACNAARQSTNHDNLTVAMVRCPPPNWPLPILNYNWTGIVFNIFETVDKAIDLLNEASANGANVVMFPELWFPGFPKGMDGSWSMEFLPSYIENSFVVGDEQWNRLIDGVAAAGVYAEINFAERTDSLLFMAQALVSPVGDILIHRHKLRPSGDERAVFTDGTIGEITAVTTPYGRVGLLECGEHQYPSMTFTMHAQMENWHLGPFPYMVDANNTDALWWEGAFAEMATMGHYANLGNTYTFTAAVGVAFVMTPLSQLDAYMSDTIDFDEHPMLYHSINTSSFDSSITYDANAQVSWGVLQQILQGFPSYIPRDEGDFVAWHSVNITEELSGTYNMSEPGASGPSS